MAAHFNQHHAPPTRLLAASVRREPLLTITQTAERLQLSEKTVRRHIADGSLIAHQIGRQWRIDGADLDDYLRNARRVTR